MRLTELHPRWIHPDVFVFRCPHCRDIWLSCKRAPMSRDEQDDLFQREMNGEETVATQPEYSWGMGGTVPSDPKATFIQDLTVTPSIDASKSGHWHGNITNGEIVGGIP